LKNQVQARPIRVQQAFFKFTHLQTKHQVIAPTKTTTATRQTQLNFVIEEHAKQFDYLSGEYDLELIVGDSFIQNAFIWKICKLVITLPAAPASHVSPRIQTRNTPLPEIKHQFRLPEKRPAEVISLAFTALVLSPLLLLFFGLIRVGANINRFPSSFMGLIYALSFEASIISILLLFVLYWLYLNMFQTLGYLAILAIPTIIFGQRTLRLLSEEGDKKRKPKQE